MGDLTRIDVRQRIIETALRLFYKQGYLATGINQIISEAGVAKASFYQHFPAKEDLCISYLREAHQMWLSKLKQFADFHEQPRECLLNIFNFLEKFMKKNDFRGCSLLNLISEFPCTESKVRQEVLSQKNIFRKYLKNLIQTLKESSDQYSKIDVNFLSESIYILIEGALVESQNFGDTWPITVAHRTVETLIGPK